MNTDVKLVRMKLFQIMQYVIILVIAVFVWGCAVPPAVSPEMGKSTSVELGKKNKKKVQANKKQKKRKKSVKKVQGQELLVDSVMQEMSTVGSEEASPELVVVVLSFIMIITPSQRSISIRFGISISIMKMVDGSCLWRYQQHFRLISLLVSV